MRLADFLDQNVPAILAQWESFVASLTPAASGMDSRALRDHAEQILLAIANDLRQPQTAREQSDKSKGNAPVVAGTGETAAQTHAVLRATDGFSIRQLVAEYRALRASVLQLWRAAEREDAAATDDIDRFNEAIDQAITESVDFFTTEVDRWRALFLGVLGHDLRGPLNAVLLISQAVSTMSAGTPISAHMARLIRSGERMKDLLDDLLDYNRGSLRVGIRVQKAPVDLSESCRQELEVLQAALPSSILEFARSGSTEGHWDPSRIRQIVSNLVTNAAKYGDGTGAIRVNAEGGVNAVRLSVENTGPNIPEDQQKALFEPMRRHASSERYGERESLGLGLYIVQQIAAAHGGEASVMSLAGRTCFTVTLPKA